MEQGAIILCGGKSSRMGRDKATLPFGPEQMLQRVVRLLGLVVDLGKTEARLPKKEQSRLENFSVGDRIRCVIKSVEKTGKNAGVIISRAAPELVMRLFEQEVPEIYDNTVSIRGCSREAGERTAKR